MGCGSGCGTENNIKECQDLSGWNGLSLQELQHRLDGQTQDEVRVYTVATTRLDKVSDAVCHMGSGPNLEGGLVTLCTCKHSMRQYHATKDWKGKWILGLTSRAIGKGFHGEHYLLYMMRVAEAFGSHRELYDYLASTNRHALDIKNAVENPLGDVFEPKRSCGDPLNPEMYKKPHASHSHGANGDTQWHEDIIYKGKSAPLLLGDVGNTFVWPQPMIIFGKKRNSGNMKLTLGKDAFSFLEARDGFGQ